jgi:hypothetical protein
METRYVAPAKIIKKLEKTEILNFKTYTSRLLGVASQNSFSARFQGK